MNLSTKQKQIDTENRLVVAKREVGRGGFGLGVWDKQMQTITYRMNEQQGLLYSTGNYIQNTGINHNGKESLSCTAEINTAL